jgi:hypothetical protein
MVFLSQSNSPLMSDEFHEKFVGKLCRPNACCVPSQLFLTMSGNVRTIPRYALLCWKHDFGNRNSRMFELDALFQSEWQRVQWPLHQTNIQQRVMSPCIHAGYGVVNDPLGGNPGQDVVISISVALLKTCRAASTRFPNVQKELIFVQPTCRFTSYKLWD